MSDDDAWREFDASLRFLHLNGVRVYQERVPMGDGRMECALVMAGHHILRTDSQDEVRDVIKMLRQAVAVRLVNAALGGAQEDTWHATIKRRP